MFRASYIKTCIDNRLDYRQRLKRYAFASWIPEQKVELGDGYRFEAANTLCRFALKTTR
jgi:hypothetical protein